MLGVWQLLAKRLGQKENAVVGEVREHGDTRAALPEFDSAALEHDQELQVSGTVGDGEGIVGVGAADGSALQAADARLVGASRADQSEKVARVRTLKRNTPGERSALPSGTTGCRLRSRPNKRAVKFVKNDDGLVEGP